MASLLGPLRSAAHRAPAVWPPVAGPSTRRHLSSQRQRSNQRALGFLDPSLNEEVMAMYEKAASSSRATVRDKHMAHSVRPLRWTSSELCRRISSSVRGLARSVSLTRTAWHARPFRRARRLLQALFSGHLHGQDYRRLLFTLKQDVVHGLYHPQRRCARISDYRPLTCQRPADRRRPARSHQPARASKSAEHLLVASHLLRRRREDVPAVSEGDGDGRRRSAAVSGDERVHGAAAGSDRAAATRLNGGRPDHP